VSVSGIDGLTIASGKEFTVNPASERLVALSLQMNDAAIRSGTHPILFKIQSMESKEIVKQKSTFYMPR